MPDATVTYDLADALGTDFDPSRTKLWVEFNTENNRVTDADGKVRIGAGESKPNADGTGTIAGIPIPSASTNPVSFQVKIHYDAPAKAFGQRNVKRDVGDFGWMTIAASGDLADLEAEQYVPPEYLTTVTAQLDALVDAAETALDGYADAASGSATSAASSATAAQSARTGAEAAEAVAQALVLSDLGTTDGQTRALIENPTSQTAGALSATLAPRTSFAAATGEAGRTNVETNAAIDDAEALSTKSEVFVGREAGPWTVSRSDPGDQKSGGIVMRPGVPVTSDGAEIRLDGNADLIKAWSSLAAPVTITADLAATDTTLTLASSAGFAPGDSVFVRLGQAAYDSAEPDYWLFATVATIPNGTQVTLDRPVGFPLDVSEVPTADQKSIAKVTELMDHVAVAGDWAFESPGTAPASNAEGGVSMRHVPNARVGRLRGRNMGAGLLVAQFVDQLSVESMHTSEGRAQAGQASKGRTFTLSEVRAADIGTVVAERFEKQVGFVEGRSEAVTLRKFVTRNTFPGRSSAEPVLSIAGNTRMTVDDWYFSGNESVLYDEGGSTGNSLRVRRLFCYGAARPIVPDLSIVREELTVGGVVYPQLRTYRRVINLTTSLAIDTTLPISGYLTRVRAYCSDKTGMDGFAVGADTSGGYVADQVSTLVTGSTVDLPILAGFGSPYAASKVPNKRFYVYTNGTAPGTGKLVLEFTYWSAGGPDVGDTITPVA